MPKQFTRIDAYKMMTLELAKHHKKRCDGETCNISLMLLKEMAERLGIEFTDEEKAVFI